MKNLDNYMAEWIEKIKQTVGNEKVLLATSGGVDSSVCAALLSKAVPDQLICVFVDHGFMRLGEGDAVEAAFKDKPVQFIRVNGEERFLAKIAGIADPEKKRKLIGEEFIHVFEEEAKKLGHIPFLAQGTISLDIEESKGAKGVPIKSHHNVGGLPELMDFTGIVEPLAGLNKEEVRVLGRMLGLPAAFVNRQPFPGPGLAVRCLGELTKPRLDLLREADAIFRAEIAEAGLNREIGQYFAVLTNIRSVGIKGDSRTYDYTVGLRAVTTTDFMKAGFARIPYEVLEKVSGRIVDEVAGVNRVVYDVTPKPPATIEWE